MRKKDEKAIEVTKQEIVEAEDMERTRELQCFIPKTDIYETDGDVFMALDIPGVDKKTVDITLEKNTLTLNAYGDPKKYEGYSLSYAEFEPGDFERSFRLPDDIDPDKIEASVNNGQLIIYLPKAEAEKAKKIQISST